MAFRVTAAPPAGAQVGEIRSAAIINIVYGAILFFFQVSSSLACVQYNRLLFHHTTSIHNETEEDRGKLPGGRAITSSSK